MRRVVVVVLDGLRRDLIEDTRPAGEAAERRDEDDALAKGSR